MQERTAIFLVVIPVFIIVMLVRGNVAAATGITVGWALASTSAERRRARAAARFCSYCVMLLPV